jgi:quinone-modifying oxidoreductase, subunit QmoC
MKNFTFQEPVKRREAELNEAFWKQIHGIPRGEKIQNCIQCGTCSGACPVSYMMDITPREVVALFRAGRLEEILHSRTIWICASCYACRVRCPSGILVTDMMYALKRLGMQKKIFPKHFPVYALSEAFMQNVYKYGRSYEPGLLVSYCMKAGLGKLFANTGFALALFKKGRISAFPHTIKRVNEVRAIIDRATELEREH